MPDRNQPEHAATPVEGVRIIGAEEAQSAVESNALDLPALEERERAERPEYAPRRVGYPEQGPSWSAAPEVPAATDPPSGEVPPLPHWTEPPTGAVPAIFADDDGDPVDDDFDVWAPITGSQPRFRAEESDWADADFADELSGEHEQEERLGALDEAGPVDEEADFAEALAEKRRRPAVRARKTRAAAVATAAGPRPPRRPSEPELAPPGPARARDLPTAIMTGVTIAIVALICFRSATLTALLAAVIIGFASLEFCVALRSKGMRPATLLVLVSSAMIPLAAKHYGTESYPIFFALIAVFAMLWFLWEVTPGRPLLGVATTVLAFTYIGGLGGFAGLMLGRKSGVGLIVGVVLCVIAYDIAGFFVGSQFGRTPIAPKVSPNKSVQGTVAGMAASVIVGVVIVGAIGPWTRGWGFALGVLVAIGAFLGDLCASMIKRDVGIKDFGTILPGHGGVLDRFDGLLFCLPIAYYLAIYAKII